jgi:creatinine amidohydrolase
MRTIRLKEMNWPDIKEAMKKGFTTVVFALGSTEQHGPHLPIKTDSKIGDALAYRVAEKLGFTLQGPTISLGCSDHHLAFPGTISLQPETLKAVIADYVGSLEKHGFKTIILLPSHGGNFTAVKEAVQELGAGYPHLEIWGFTDLNAFVKAFITFSAEFNVTAEEAGAHAGESETSLMMALNDNLVAKNRFQAGYTGDLGDEQIQVILKKGMPALTDIGVLGDPTKASSVKGMIYLERLADFIVEAIKENKVV